MAIFHLQRRRGYLSNRGIQIRKLLAHLGQDPDHNVEEIEEEIGSKDEDSQDAKNKKEEVGKVLDGIRLLKQENLQEKTLSQFIWEQAQKTKTPSQRITRHGKYVPNDKKEDVPKYKRFYAERYMYKDEFTKIWEKQKTNPKLGSILSDELKKNIEKSIFFQRPLQSQKGKVGRCSFMPARKRTHKATLEFQEYRVRQLINHIKVKGEPLADYKKEELFNCANDINQLNNNGRLAWASVKKIISAEKKDLNFQPGLDETQDTNTFCKSGLVGNRTLKRILDAIDKDRWNEFSPDDQSQIVKEIIYYEDKVALYKRLHKHWKFSDGYNKDAFKLASINLMDDDYAKHCLYVVNKLLEHLRQGLIYSEACEEAGFLREDNNPVLNGQSEPEQLLRYTDVDYIANPRVQKALYEVRKLVNSIYKAYGKPSIIRVEMARDMKNSKKVRRKIEHEQQENRKQNAQAEQEIREEISASPKTVFGSMSPGGNLYVNKKDVNKYKMWKWEQRCLCPYCGKRIPWSDMASGQAEIEHILPQTSFADDYMNTVVACKDCNAEKNGRSPYEAWGNNEDRWHTIEKNMKKFAEMPDKKKERILMEDFEPTHIDDFCERQLRDTAYIAVACKNMLKKSGVDVRVSKGGATSMLRSLWGLNNILPYHPDDDIDNLPRDQQNSSLLVRNKQLKDKPKNRKDHRHHAIDALIVSLTNNAILQKMVKYRQNKQRDNRKNNYKFDKPSECWEQSNLHSYIKKKLMNTVVSHSPTRKISGALHEETVFSKSHYVELFEIKCSNSCIKDICGYLQNDENSDGEVSWIIGENIRDILRKWIEDNKDNKKGKDITLPLNPSGKTLKYITLAHRCYTTTKSLTEIMDKGELKYCSGKWTPGKGKWIADKQVFESIQQWKKENQNNIGEGLLKNPPKIINKKGDESEIIRSVRLAEIKNKDSIITLSTNGKVTKIYESGSNHHVEIFRQVSPGTDGKRKKKGRFITMFVAANRAANKIPIVDTQPDQEWDGQWEFWLSLCANDIVKMPEDDEKVKEDRKLGPSYYRIKKMTHSGDKLYFEHNSVSASENSDDPGFIQISINALPDKMSKVEISVLGLPG